MKVRWNKICPLLSLATVLTLAACGGGAQNSQNPNLNGGPAAVNFSLQIKGASPGASGTGTPSAIRAFHSSGDGSAASHDDAGTPIALTEFRVNLRDIEFYLPQGVHCADLSFQFTDPVKCDGEDDANEVENEADDNPTDDNSNDAENENGDDSHDSADASESKTSDDSDDEDKIEVEGPFVVDLISGTSLPSLTNLLIPAGTYTRVDIRLEEAKTEDGLLAAGDPLLGHTLAAEGSFEYQGATHALHLRLKFNEEIRFKNSQGMAIAETGANDVVVKLDPSIWFQGINLTQCLDQGNLTLEPDGSLVIDEKSGRNECGDIENVIKDNIEASGSVIKDDEDDDDDGVTDADDPDDDNDGTPDDQD